MKLSNRLSVKAVCILLIASAATGWAEEHVGDITRFSPKTGQPLFPVGNINIFKQYAFGFEESLKVGKSVDLLIGSVGAEAEAEVGATMGFEFGLCIGGNADYDLAFKPRITVPDKIPYEYPLTLHISEGLMGDSQFTTNFPPLGKLYADLIFDVKTKAEFEACVFGCVGKTPFFNFDTGELDKIVYAGLPLPANVVPPQLRALFAKSVRCDPSVDRIHQAYTGIELASWNRNEDSKFKILNVFADDFNEFTRKPRLEYSLGVDSSFGDGSRSFTVSAQNKDDNVIVTSLRLNQGGAVTVSGAQLPNGLAAKKVYYVASASGNKYKLARRKGGSPLDIKGAGSGKIEKNDPEKPASPDKKGGWGQISISASTVSTDSSVSEIDAKEYPFTADANANRLRLTNEVESFSEGTKVRVKSDGNLPGGLSAACVYYIAPNANQREVLLVTQVGGMPVEIDDSGTGTHKIFRSAEFNSVDGLSSTGAEDVAAVTIDAIGMISDVVLQKSLLKMSGGLDLGVADINYKIASLEVGPAIQLKTDFKMTWDLVIDDILFRKAGTMQPMDVKLRTPTTVQFPALINQTNRTRFTSLKGAMGHLDEVGAFPNKVFHLTNTGPFAIPEISLVNGEAVSVSILYHVEPKLKTKVSAPFLGRVKYEALAVDASIKKVGSLNLGPLIEGEHEFNLGEFTFYDGDPFNLDDDGNPLTDKPVHALPRTDFEESQDRDRYELTLVDQTLGQSEPVTGCAEVVVIKKSDGLLYVTVFDVEGEEITDRSGKAEEVLGMQMAGELARQLDKWPEPTPDQKTEILKTATKIAGLTPGVMTFTLQAAGPADFHWKPLDSWDSTSELDFANFGKRNTDAGFPAGVEPNDGANLFNYDHSLKTINVPDEAGVLVEQDVSKGYPLDGRPSGYWRYGYLAPSTRKLADDWEETFPVNSFKEFLSNTYNAETKVYRDTVNGVYMGPLAAAPSGPQLLRDANAPASLKTRASEAWPVRRWHSPGGKVDITWGVSMLPRLGLTQAGATSLLDYSLNNHGSNGVTGTVYVNGKKEDTATTNAVPLMNNLPGNVVSYRLEIGIASGTNFADTPQIFVTNTGTVKITEFQLTIGDERGGFDFMNVIENSASVIDQFPESFAVGGNNQGDEIALNILLKFRNGGLAPGQRVGVRVDIDSDAMGTGNDFRNIFFNNGAAPNSVATAFTARAGYSETLPNSLAPSGEQPYFRFESGPGMSSSRLANLEIFDRKILSLDLNPGDVVDLVLSPKGRDGTHDSWQDEALMYMNIETLVSDEWAPLNRNQETPTNWAELLSGGGAHKPNAWPGALFTGEIDPLTGEPAKATNWATINNTIDSAPFPRLTTQESIGTLQVKENARLNFAPQGRDAATLKVFDGAVANDGTINLDSSDRGASGAVLILGTPSTRSMSLTGGGTLQMNGSTLIAGDRNATSGNFSFINYNRIQGSGSAMDIFQTHASTLSTRIENMNWFHASSGILRTGAKRFVNKARLFASGEGTLRVRGEEFENQFGGIVSSNLGAGATVELAFDQAVNSGLIRASNGTKIRLLRGKEINSVWSAGLEDSEVEMGAFNANRGGIIELDSTHMTGGTFTATEGGSIITNTSGGAVFFTGSTIDIGTYDPLEIKTDSGSLVVNTNLSRYTGVALRNFGTMEIGPTGDADFIDSRLFENHGLVRVRAGGLLQFREITERTGDPLASEVAQSYPGLGNATKESLLGGIWEIAGGVLIDGAAITKIGADSAPITTFGATDDFGQPIPGNNAVPPEVCGLSLCRPAVVVLIGKLGSIPALNTLNLNCGTLHLIGGARMPAAVDRTTGELTNRSKIIVEDSSLMIGGRYNQEGAAAVLSVGQNSEVSSGNNTYHVRGGKVTVARRGQFMNLNANRDSFLPGTSIFIKSPYIREGAPGEEAQITPASVEFADDVNITRIDAGVFVTLHGRAVNFPTTSIQSNAGSLTVSGDYGLDNRGDVAVAGGDITGFPFSNTGRIHILGNATQLRSGTFTQSGNGLTTIFPGAKLVVLGDLDVAGGEVVIEIEARPFHPQFSGSIAVGGSQANFNGNLVINFSGDFQDLRPDIGDTWEIIPQGNSATITGFENVTYRVAGLPLPIDWLPSGTHLEAVQFDTRFGKRGLGIRLVPDDGFIGYDDFVKGKVDGTLGDYGALSADYFFGSGAGNTAERARIQQGLFELNGRQFYQMSYRRRTGVDASFSTFASSNGTDWNRVSMTVLTIVKDESGFETVTMRSTFPLPDQRVSLRLQGTLNLEKTALGLIPEKPIPWNHGSPLAGLEFALREDVFQLFPEDELPYRVVPGKVLYFQTKGNAENQNSTYGGTAANGVDRDFIYMDGSFLDGAALHAGLLDNGGPEGLIKVTFIEPQGTFIGSTQGTNNNSITSQSIVQQGEVEYSYRVDPYDPDAEPSTSVISEAMVLFDPLSLSDDANLLSFIINSGAFSPAFSQEVSDYAANVGNDTSTVTVTATVANPVATLSVNGSAVSSGDTVGPIELSPGANPISVAVAAEDGTTKIYWVTVTREEADVNLNYEDWIAGFYGSDAADAPKREPDADPDQDGLTNGQEFDGGTIPNDVDSFAGDIYHPADLNDDWSIPVGEAVKYVTAFLNYRAGEVEWERPPHKPPVGYAVRAATIFLRGERSAYNYDTSEAKVPGRWKEVRTQPLVLAQGEEGTDLAKRSLPSTLQDGQPFPVSIEVKPAAGTIAYGLVETVPRGSVVTEISDKGTFDPETREVRWLLFDGNERTLSYVLDPAGWSGTEAAFTGEVDFTGGDPKAVSGDTSIGLEAPTGLVLRSYHYDNGKVQLVVDGPIGEIYQLERSQNLIRWEGRGSALPKTDASGPLEFSDSSQSAPWYYRVRTTIEGTE